MGYLATSGDVLSNTLETAFDFIVKNLAASNVAGAKAALATIPPEYHEKIRTRLLSRKPPLPAGLVDLLIPAPLFSAGGGNKTLFIAGGLGLAVLLFWKMRKG